MAVTAAKATLLDPWFDEITESNGDEYPTNREVECLQLFLCGQTTVFRAASDIMTMDEGEKLLDDKSNRLAWLLLQAAIHFQAQQPQLLELIEAIRALSDEDLEVTDEQRTRCPSWRKWKDLGSFELLLDETRRSYWAYRYTPDKEFDESPDDCYRRWESVQSFYAHRFMQDKANMIPLQGIAQISTALEREDAQLDDSVLNAEVPAAAQWLLIAGKVIFKWVVDKYEPAGHGPQLDSTSSISRDQWNAWKQRLASLDLQKSLNERTKALAEQTLDRMRSIEQS